MPGLRASPGAENKEFPERSLLVGVPVRPMREVGEQEIQHLIIERAAKYRALAADERDAGHNTAAG